MPDLRPVVKHERALTLLGECFSTPITGLVTVEGGSVARTFAFRTDGQEYILRFNLDKMLTSNFPKEAYLAKKLIPHQIPIAPIIQVGQQEDLHFIISQRMPGRMLEEHTPEEVIHILPELIELLARLHQIDVSDTSGYGVFDYKGKGMATSWYTSLASVIEEEDEQDYFGRWHTLFETTFLERAFFEEIYQRMLQLLTYCPTDRALLYRGCSLRNILALNGKITALLDWLDAGYGDFVYDIAGLDYWCPWLGVRQRFQQYYQTQQRTIPFYEERILCYQCYTTLIAMRFYAKSGEENNYRWVKAQILQRIKELT